MKIFRHLYGALRAGRTTALHAHAYWGHCAHCDTTAPWVTNVWTGEYRCTRCGADQLGSNDE